MCLQFHPVVDEGEVGLVPFLHRVVSMVSMSVGRVILLCFVSVLRALSWLVRSVLSLVCFLLR